MQYRQLGRTGLQVSEIGVGCAPFGMTDYIEQWDATSEQAQVAITRLVHHAIDLGYNYFDTAPAYGGGRSEELLGQAIKGKRDKVYVATKLGRGVTDIAYNRVAWSPEAIRQSVDVSLARMGIDYIDVILFHGGDYSDGSDVVILEQGGIEACQRLQQQGKIRYIGFTAESNTGNVARMVNSGLIDTIQITYHVMATGASDFEKGHGIIRQAHAQNMGILSMRPMTGGVFMRLMGLYFPNLDRAEIGRMLLTYVLSDPYVDCALVGTRKPSRLDSNNAISDDVSARIDLEDLHQYFLAKRKS